MADRKQPKFWEPEADYDELTWDNSHKNLYLPYLKGGKDPESLHVTTDVSSPNRDVFKDTADLPSFRPMSGLPHSDRMPKSEEGDESLSDEDDSEGNPKTFMRVLTRFAERTSMQGVPYINMSSVWYAKAGWAVLFAVGFVAMCFHLYYLFKEYYAYDTHSVVTLGFNTLSFPAVTICNINPIKSSMMKLTSPELQAFVQTVEPSNIAYSMEEKRKGFGGDNSGGSSSSSGGSSGEDKHGEPPPMEESPGMNADHGNEQPEDTNTSYEQPFPGDEIDNEQASVDNNTNGDEEEQPPEENEDTNTGVPFPDEENNNEQEEQPALDGNGNNDGKEQAPVEDAFQATITPGNPDTFNDVTSKAAISTSTSQIRVYSNNWNVATGFSRSSDSNGSRLDSNTRAYQNAGTTTASDTNLATESKTTIPVEQKGTTATETLLPDTTTTKTTASQTSIKAATTIMTTTEAPGKVETSAATTGEQQTEVTSADKETITSASSRPTQSSSTDTPSSNGAPPPGGNGPPPIGSSSGDQPKVRRRRFVDGFTISETNTRYKQDDNEDIGAVQDGNRLAGNKSTLRAIEDEFKFLFTSIGRDIRASIGHQIEDMLMECSFRGIECDESYFRLTQTAEYGNCFTLEREDYISVLGGPGDGLSMIFFTQDEEYLHGITNSLGFKVHIHQPGSWPNPYEEGIAVSAGVETNIALKQVNIDRLGQPHGSCEPGEAFFNKYRITYTQKTCQQFCVQSLVMTRCDCFDNEKEEMYRRIDEYKQTNISRSCMSSVETACLNDVYRNFQSGAVQCDCPSPCDERIYTKFISTKQWPTEQYATILVEHLCNLLNETECLEYSTKSRSDLALSFLKLVLYFEDLNYENITEEPNYELFQFVSDVGGTIGLWIGLSLISFFEVLQFFYEVVHYLAYVKPRQKAKIAKKKKMRQKQQSIRHALRFSNDMLSGKNRLHTVSGKLKQATLESSNSSDKKSRKSRGESPQSSESSLSNMKNRKSEMRAPPYESIIGNGGYNNNNNYNDVFGYGRLNGLQNNQDTSRI